MILRLDAAVAEEKEGVAEDPVVGKDYLKEECCGRAVLVSPNDGNVLAMYAELVWMIHKDLSRAESNFN
ncbi:unnamed protein product [Eruca vesicaria subsp. sativa]|uniref:Uncharacterized protein n=1 Tax=Eruca vesicaria subsp. sativa TaxID=29727 RepID=A0ABC8M886_ERUVS|nr:unnamed protein product [Eruca vesicaria subsp. sativa]